MTTLRNGFLSILCTYPSQYTTTVPTTPTINFFIISGQRGRTRLNIKESMNNMLKGFKIVDKEFLLPSLALTST